MIYEILMSVVQLARPMSSLDPHVQGLELQWEHFQINNNLNAASRSQFDLFSNWPLSKMINLMLLTLG